MNGSTNNGTLVDLDDTDQVVAHPDEDIRGRTVLDANGQEIGQVDGLLIDEKDRHVRFLAVGSGGFLGFGKKTRLIPSHSVKSADEVVRVDTTREDVASSPAYDPELTEKQDFTPFYNYYGVPFFPGEEYQPTWPRVY